MNIRLNRKTFLLMALLAFALILTAVFFHLSQRPLVSKKKALAAHWGPDDKTLFYLAEQDLTETSFRKLKIYPFKRDEKIGLDFEPEDAVWINNEYVLLADPKLNYQKGHYIRMNLNDLSQEPVYLPVSGKNFSFSQEGEEIIILNAVEKGIRLSRYDMEREEVTDTILLPEELENIFKASWLDREKALLHISKGGFSSEQKYYILDLESEEVKEISRFEDRLFSPEARPGRILFNSPEGLVLYDIKENAKRTISETSEGLGYGISYAFVDDKIFVYFKIKKEGGMDLYLFNLEKNERYLLARFEGKGSYMVPPKLHISPSKKKVALKNPEGYLQIIRIRR